MEKAQASFQRRLDETHFTFLTLLKHLNFLRSDLETKKSASHEIPWCSLLCRDLHCSSGLVIKPDHLWGTKSHLHASNESEKCHSQQARLALTPTPPSFGSGGLVEQGPQPQWAQRCHPLCSALLVPCSMNVGRTTSKICCHLSSRTTTYWQTPQNLPSVPCSQTTNWTETHITSY